MANKKTNPPAPDQTPENAESSAKAPALNPKPKSLAEPPAPPGESASPPALISPPKPPLVIVKPNPARDKATETDRSQENPSPDGDRSEQDDRSAKPRPAIKLAKKITQCGNFKAGDLVTLPYSGKEVELKSFYQGESSGEWWATFDGGCIRMSALPEVSRSSD
jgi:hypothetical protein